MITSWGVSNFKSIRDAGEFSLAPLTIFAGANSSGKSTFIQSILLIAQTLANKVSSRSVVFNGALTSLGQFDDLRSIGSEADQIVVSCTCHPLPDSDGQLPASGLPLLPRRGPFYGRRGLGIREVSFGIAFDADPSSPDRETFQIQPRLFSSTLQCVLRDEDNVDQTYSISVHHAGAAATASKIRLLEDVTGPDEYLRGGLAYDVALDDTSMAEVKEDVCSARPVGCLLRHFLPTRILYAVDQTQEDARAITTILHGGRTSRAAALNMRFPRADVLLLNERMLTGLRDILERDGIDWNALVGDSIWSQSIDDGTQRTLPLELWQELIRSAPRQLRVKIQQSLQESDGLLDVILNAMRHDESTSRSTNVIQFPAPRQISEAARYIDEFFASSVKYLGPLRDAPKPLYPLSPTADPYDVGLRGEHTASVLELHKSRQVRYVPSSRFMSSRVELRSPQILRTLEAAVIDWLQYLGVAGSVESKDMGKFGHALKVSLPNSEGKHDLTHVGVGVSQVLPILVMCLLADPDSTLVFEQPELHLHPKVQTLLGDFFLSMALCNKQCVVETHSEYLIDRLRFRIAAADGSDLTDKTKIYFVEKPGIASEFREVKS